MIILENSRLQNSCCLRRDFFKKCSLRRVKIPREYLGIFVVYRVTGVGYVTVWLQPFMVASIPNLPQLSTGLTRDIKVLQSVSGEDFQMLCCLVGFCSC